MTQEEKAKAYDRAIEELRGLLEGIHEEKCDIMEEDIIRIFPELKESEDEKIRKEMIDFLQETIDEVGESPNIWTMGNAKRWMAWLKKQGEPNPYSGISFKYNGHTWGMCARDNGVEILMDSKLIKHLDKQGEQKQTVIIPRFRVGDVITSTKNSALKYKIKAVGVLNELGEYDYVVEDVTDTDYKGRIHEMSISKVDEWGVVVEQKPTWSEEDELKSSILIHVVKKQQGSAIFEGLLPEELIEWLEKKGEQKPQGKSALEAINEETVDNANKVEPKFKDGDILNSPSHHLIWIYRDNEHYYACLNMNYVTKNVAIGGLIKIPSDARPATKDERTILFRKLKKFGYEWDKEKKQLKKKVIHKKLTEFEKAVKQVMEEAIECGDTRNLKADADMLLNLVQKTAWSEEDKKKVNNLYVLLDQMVRFNILSDKDATEFKNWLKALKDRVLSQPKQEWSEEDLCKIENALFGTYAVDVATRLLNKIKALRPQSTWKPSDE